MRPALVLLSGMDGTGRLFASLRAALGASFDPIVVRYPDVPAGYAAHARIAIAQLPTDRPYLLLGESFSGPIAVMIAASRPAFLRGMILCASFLTCPRPLLRWAPAPLRWLSVCMARTRPAAWWLMRPYAAPQLRAAYLESMHAVTPGTLSARLAAIAAVDVRHEARLVRVPCLYLRATADKLVRPAAVEECLRSLARARIELLDGPHFILQTAAAQAAAAIRRFASELEPAARPWSRAAGPGT